MKRVTGEDGARVRLEGLPYAQIPDRAITLSGHAYKLLGRLQRIAGSKTSVEVDDQDLGQWIKRSRQTVQRAWKELEAAGLIERRRGGGRRRILLLYSLAGRETARGRMVHACLTERQMSETSAWPKSETCMAQKRHMHVSGVVHPLKRENEEKSKTPAVVGQASGGPPPTAVEEPNPELTLAQWWATFRRGELPGAQNTAAGTSPKDPQRPR